jgi:hypothetical protein
MEGAVVFPIRLSLPKNLSGSAQKVFVSKGGQLPYKTQRVTPEMEGALLEAMAKGLNNEFGLTLATTFEVDRSGTAMPKAAEKKKSLYVVCGGSNASRLADALEVAGQ